jgi:hypothetical protein
LGHIEDHSVRWIRPLQPFRDEYVQRAVLDGECTRELGSPPSARAILFAKDLIGGETRPAPVAGATPR